MCLIRVVIEAHSAATKKNKEWQEKLPIVVFKAEEIMYSKANSEVFILLVCLSWLFGSQILGSLLCYLYTVLYSFFALFFIA